MAKTLAGETHRVPVVDAKTGLVTNIISQSSIIDFLNKHAKQVKAEMSKTVDDWKLGTSPVLAIRDNARAVRCVALRCPALRCAALHLSLAPALCLTFGVGFGAVQIEAFRVMSEKHMSGLAVCDASGMFLANTASTDLKLYLAHSNLGAQLLEEPILDFLSQLRQDDIKVSSPALPCPPLLLHALPARLTRSLPVCFACVCLPTDRHPHESAHSFGAKQCAAVSGHRPSRRYQTAQDLCSKRQQTVLAGGRHLSHGCAGTSQPLLPPASLVHPLILLLLFVCATAHCAPPL